MKHMWDICRAGAIYKVGMGEGNAYHEYKDQATVEWLIIKNNVACFCLTNEDTPPMTEPLLSDLGISGRHGCRRRYSTGYLHLPSRYWWKHKDFLKFIQQSPNITTTDRINTTFPSKQRFLFILEEGKREDLVVDLHLTLWALQDHNQEWQTKQTLCSFHQYCHQLWLLPQAMAERLDCDAGKEKRMWFWLTSSGLSS
jgi:hypothetical protein